MQLPEEYKENVDERLRFWVKAHRRTALATNFPTKGLRSKRRSSPCIFQVVASLSTDVFVIIGTTYVQADIIPLIVSVD
jgi:hypothetical protein